MYYKKTYYQSLSITIAYDAHGTLAGAASEFRKEGTFWSGFASGAVASFVSTSTGIMTAELPKAWQVSCMVAAGGLSGGVTATMAGGDFWDGVCNGLICSGLNHALHMIAGPDDPPDSNEISVDRSKGNNSGELLAALGSGWAIAAAEPTFLGEVIMGIASIGLGGYYAIKELSQSQLIKKNEQ